MIDVCLSISDKPLLSNQWSYVLSHYKLDNIYIIGNNKWNDLHHLRDAISIETAEELPNKPLVVLAPKDGRYVQGETSLKEFKHPSECIYLFGADHEQLSESDLGMRKPEHTVFIPTDTTHEMYAHVAAAITLYDRAVKHG